MEETTEKAFPELTADLAAEELPKRWCQGKYRINEANEGNRSADTAK